MSVQISHRTNPSRRLSRRLFITSVFRTLTAFAAFGLVESVASAQGPFAIFATTSRAVTDSEILDGAPSGATVYEFFVTYNRDISSISGRVREVEIFQSPFASDVEAPDPTVFSAHPAAAADSFITTPGVTTLQFSRGFNGGDTWRDVTDDIPRTNFRFAQITTAQIGNFTGHVSLGNFGVGFDFSMGHSVDLELALRYHDPADPTERGTWKLLAGTKTQAGLAGLRVVLNDVSIEAGQVSFASNIGSIDPVELDGATRPRLITNGTSADIAYAQDLDGTVVNNVGYYGLSNPRTGPDLIAFGSFGAIRPSFGAPSHEEIVASLLTSTAAPFTAVLADLLTTKLTGDSVAFDGLLLGDHDRNGTVNSGDMGHVLTNFNGVNKGWDTGDSNDDGIVNSRDLNVLLINFNRVFMPSSQATIPEPRAIILLAIALGFAISRNRT